MTDELKPCHVCGSDDVDIDYEREIVLCAECGYSLYLEGVGTRSTVKMWNTRAIEDDLRAENEKIKNDFVIYVQQMQEKNAELRAENRTLRIGLTKVIESYRKMSL